MERANERSSSIVPSPQLAPVVLQWDEPAQRVGDRTTIATIGERPTVGQVG